MIAGYTMQLLPQPIYFHGLPGADAELRLFGPEIYERTEHFNIAKRHIPNASSGTDAFEIIANDIRRVSGGLPLRLIGFSLGASTALRVAPLLGPQVEQIDIISAAAPLQTGNYLEKMAGAPVFRAAKKHPLAFNLLSQCQSILSKVAPKLLYSVLFSKAQGNDLKLRDDPHFRTVMTQILAESLGSELATYRSEIYAYVDDWSQTLGKVCQPVSIYHGALDNWSPLEMASGIANALSNCMKLEVLDDCSHYSTLREFLQQV
jgi:pimeloyl-ACP methyl ester carboxylesterase